MPKRHTERHEFANARGERLAADVDLPPGEATAWALLAHCFTCSKDLKAMRRISRKLAERGIAVMRLDFTGIGQSEGDFADTDFSSNIEDLIAAAQFLEETYEPPRLLVGHSLGGTAALVAASKIESVQAVATIAAPSDTEHLRDLLVEKAPSIEESGKAEVNIAGRSFTIRKELLEDLSLHAVEEAVRALRCPLLLFHSPLDRVVGIDHARRIYEAAKHPKSFVSLDEADHLLAGRDEDAEFVGEMLATWAKRYLGAAFEADEREGVERGHVVVSGDRPDMLHHVETANHRLVADEPDEHGGQDAGPNPYEFLLASLGACTAMTLRMYANRKQWSLDRVSVRTRHERVHAEDCEDCESKGGMVDRIERVIEVTGDLSDQQRERLVEIADRCPVSKTLTTETKIDTRLA